MVLEQSVSKIRANSVKANESTLEVFSKVCQFFHDKKKKIDVSADFLSTIYSLL